MNTHTANSRTADTHTVIGILLGLCAMVGLALPALARDERPSFSLAPSIHATVDEVLVEHLGDDGGARYLAMSVPFAPVAALRSAIERHLGRPLKHRGEAHITVLTPPEYEAIASYLTIERVHDLARAANIQRVVFDVPCVGRGAAEVESATEYTYFVVVSSPGLVALRRQIVDAYVAAGGPPDRFDPARWDPHITIGFTRRDLHASDGVSKGVSACWGDLDGSAPAERPR